MQVEMSGGIIVSIAIMLIVIMSIGLVVYYIRKGRAERAQNTEADAPKASSVVDADS